MATNRHFVRADDVVAGLVHKLGCFVDLKDQSGRTRRSMAERQTFAVFETDQILTDQEVDHGGSVRPVGSTVPRRHELADPPLRCDLQAVGEPAVVLDAEYEGLTDGDRFLVASEAVRQPAGPLR